MFFKWTEKTYMKAGIDSNITQDKNYLIIWISALQIS